MLQSLLFFFMFSILVQSHISVSRQKPSANQLEFLSHLGCPANGSTNGRIVCGHRQFPPPLADTVLLLERQVRSQRPPPLPAGIPKQPGKNPSHPSIPQTVWSTTWAQTKGKKTKPEVVLHSYRISVQCWTDFRLFSQFHKDALYESGATDSHLGGPQLTIPRKNIQQ